MLTENRVFSTLKVLYIYTTWEFKFLKIFDQNLLMVFQTDNLGEKLNIFLLVARKLNMMLSPVSRIY